MNKNIIKEDLNKLRNFRFLPKCTIDSIHDYFVNIIKTSINSGFNIDKIYNKDDITNAFKFINIKTKILKTTVVVDITLDEFNKQYIFNKKGFSI